MIHVILYALIILSVVGGLLAKYCDKASQQKPKRYLPEPDLPDSPAAVQPITPPPLPQPMPEPEPQGIGFWGVIGLCFKGLFAFADRLYENQPNPLVSAIKAVVHSGNDVLTRSSGIGTATGPSYRIVYLDSTGYPHEIKNVDPEQAERLAHDLQREGKSVSSEPEYIEP